MENNTIYEFGNMGNELEALAIVDNAHTKLYYEPTHIRLLKIIKPGDLK